GMKKYLPWIVIGLLAVFALMQLANPARTNPPVICDFIATNNAPAPVAAMLRASCYDCHSHETRWPWYSQVAPVSWLVANDVKDGRRNLDLSDWPTGDPMRDAKKIEDMSEEIGYKEMPPAKYTLIHGDARLTAEQRKQLTDWLDARAKQLKAQVAAQ
ncbi:MAG TPA: heme-binding domain-containing protein, partial [Verrucomicrobiae bacterium]|nr:heme-binding domain-containing protein [Verrucomicrobiae bacterium]